MIHREALSNVDQEVHGLFTYLGLFGVNDNRPTDMGPAHGIFRKESDRFQGFLIGFNPLTEPPESEIGKAIAASTSAWITLHSVYKWSLLQRKAKAVESAESLTIKFCSPPQTEVETLPRINHTLSLDHRFHTGEVSLVSSIMNPLKVEAVSPQFTLDVLHAIKHATHCAVVESPPNNESIPK